MFVDLIGNCFAVALQCEAVSSHSLSAANRIKMNQAVKKARLERQYASSRIGIIQNVSTMWFFRFYIYIVLGMTECEGRVGTGRGGGRGRGGRAAQQLPPRLRPTTR